MAINIPVIVGGVPLLCVTRFADRRRIQAGRHRSQTLTQMVSPTSKTIAIDALLIDEMRALRTGGWKPLR